MNDEHGSYELERTRVHEPSDGSYPPDSSDAEDRWLDRDLVSQAVNDSALRQIFHEVMKQIGVTNSTKGGDTK